MTDEEYIKELEGMVRGYLGPDGFEWFYYDVLPQAPLVTRLAYLKATGDDSVAKECTFCHGKGTVILMDYDGRCQLCDGKGWK